MKALIPAIALGLVSSLLGCASNPPEPSDSVFPTSRLNGGANWIPHWGYSASVTELDDAGDVDPRGRTAYCYSYPTQAAADSCAAGLCSKYGLRNGRCVWSRRGGRSQLAQSQSEFRRRALEARISGYRETCKSYGFTDASEIANCAMHMDNIIREQNAQAAAQQRQIQANQNFQRQQQIQEGYRQIGELGRDIGNGTLWPTPTAPQRVNSPSCVGLGSSVVNGFLTCRYSCNGQITTKQVRQGPCPLSP